jgi:hypothetical protein
VQEPAFIPKGLKIAFVDELWLKPSVSLEFVVLMRKRLPVPTSRSQKIVGEQGTEEEVDP